MRKIKGVLFDKDGTVVDFNATWVPVLRRLALDLADGDTARAESMLDSGGFEAATGSIAAGSLLGAGHTRDIVRHWYPEADAERFGTLCRQVDAAFLAGGVECSVPIAGAAELLRELQDAGYRLGIATNDSTAAAEAALGTLGLSGHFDRIIGYDAVANPKPAADMVHLFCAAVGLSPDEVAMVGDNAHDLHMARAAGAVAVGVLSGNSPRDALEPHADAVLGSIVDLPAWLDERDSHLGEMTFRA
jgi:phosphoglycolate phosphatase